MQDPYGISVSVNCSCLNLGEATVVTQRHKMLALPKGWELHSLRQLRKS